MHSIIVGNGEIGQSLYQILDRQDIYIDDIKAPIGGLSETYILHICFPYVENFLGEVLKYKQKFNPKYIIIHSTVPPGTCEQIGAIHSPVTGIHPHLHESLYTFTKFLAGPGASEVADYFRKRGIKVYVVDNAKSTELMKIMCTTYYAMNIEYTKQVKRHCEELGVPFELWTLWNNNYNEGYKKLGYPEYTRQNLTPIMKKQGGHCTLPNCELIDNEFTRLIKKLND